MNAGSDNEVMLQVKSGRTPEMAILYERHHERLLSYFARMTGSRDAGMDLVQDVFVRMLRYRESFRGDGGGFTTWMFTLARRVYIDHAKRADRHRHQHVSEIEQPPGGEADLSGELERRESLANLRRALLALPEEKREVILLRRFHLKGFDEIGEILGCSAATARVRAHRAFQELRRIYEGITSEAEP